jgi:hypothetical protein
VFIYFDPPLMYDRSKVIGDLTTYIETPIAICGDLSKGRIPRCRKLSSCVDYKETRRYVYGSTKYEVIKKMKLSLGPLKRGYEGECTEYQRYARQVLQYLNNRAKCIQRAWRRCISDPSYKVCRKRLQAEYQEMGN